MEGHYQDTYLFAERPFSSQPPPPPEGPSEEVLVRQILEAQTPWDVMGIPESISMRGMRRRFYALTKTLGGATDESSDAAKAFRRTKVAFDAILAQRPGSKDE